MLTHNHISKLSVKSIYETLDVWKILISEAIESVVIAIFYFNKLLVLGFNSFFVEFFTMFVWDQPIIVPMNELYWQCDLTYPLNVWTV